MCYVIILSTRGSEVEMRARAMWAECSGRSTMAPKFFRIVASALASYDASALVHCVGVDQNHAYSGCWNDSIEGDLDGRGDF